VSALEASEAKMRALERVGHASGGYSEGLHDECPEDKGENEGGYQPFEGVGDFGGSVFLFWRRLMIGGC
jgi:hypothetical protein